MSFLNPWLWLGLVALSAPLWLHLRRKPQTNIMRFSTLRFLDDCPRPQESPRRLRQLLLLALRLLGLILLVAAFTWPYLPVPERVPVEESRVYILDNSMSRQADPNWLLQRDQMIEDLKKIKSSTQAAIIVLGSQPQSILNFGDDPLAAIEPLRQLQPSYQRGSYLAALRTAKNLLDHSFGVKKHILLLADNQENQWTEHGQSPPFLSGIEVTLPSNNGTNAPNLALSEPRATRIFLADRALVNFTAKLAHAGAATNVSVVLQANDQVILNQTINLEGQPPNLTLSAQWEANAHVWLEGKLTIQAQPDALPGDDQIFFALGPVREGQVAVLAQSDYLRLALSPDVMRGHWQSRFLDINQIGHEKAEQDAEVLVLESSFLQSGEVRQLVSRYLSNRRGVFLFVNRLSPAVQGAMRELGFVPHSTEPRVAPAQAPFHFQYLQGRHPILHPFLEGEYGHLLEVEVQQFFAFESTDAFPLIIGDNGQGLLFQGTRFPGTLFVLAFDLDRGHTSWPVHPTFIPFLDLCLQNARPKDLNETEYLPGDTATLSLAATNREIDLTLTNHQTMRLAVKDGKARVPLPAQPGLYPLVLPGQSEPEKILVINPSPKESVLSYNNQPEALQFWQAGPEVTKSTSADAPLAGSPSLRGILDQRLWWWFLLAGFVALLLEQIWTAAKRSSAAA